MRRLRECFTRVIELERRLFGACLIEAHYSNRSFSRGWSTTEKCDEAAESRSEETCFFGVTGYMDIVFAGSGLDPAKARR